MPNKLIYPSANPLQVFVPDLTRDSRYNSKDFEDFDFPDTILPWEQRAGFCQPWQLNDVIQTQLRTNVGPVNWVLKSCETDEVIDTVQLDQKQESENEPGLFIYELLAPLSGYEPGCYYAEFQFGTPAVITVVTGELNFEELHENTQLAEYKHYEAREDIIFETGFFPSVRVPAIKKYTGPKQKATVYEDQVLNMSSLRSQKYRTWQWRIGLGKGIPDYFADMIGGIIGCSDFRIDGKSVTVADDAEMEANEIDGLSLRWWSVDLRDRYTRGSRTIENDVPIDAAITVMINVDSKGFGNSNTGSETIITDVI